MTEREDTIPWLYVHLIWINFREENKNIVCTDESWVNTGQEEWKDNVGDLMSVLSQGFVFESSERISLNAGIGASH
jgi:hypothetical protein